MAWQVRYDGKQKVNDDFWVNGLNFTLSLKKKYSRLSSFKYSHIIYKAKDFMVVLNAVFITYPWEFEDSYRVSQQE